MGARCAEVATQDFIKAEGNTDATGPPSCPSNRTLPAARRRGIRTHSSSGVGTCRPERALGAFVFSDLRCQNASKETLI
jgi:hypothetical protein